MAVPRRGHAPPWPRPAVAAAPGSVHVQGGKCLEGAASRGVGVGVVKGIAGDEGRRIRTREMEPK